MSYNAELHVALWIVKKLVVFLLLLLCSISDSVYHHFYIYINAESGLVYILKYNFLLEALGNWYSILVIVLELQSLH